jgi:Sensors of blue-light using FAD
MLERIVYVSRAAPGLGLDAVFGIIREAHRANDPDELTGVLVFLDGCFAQVIEGERAPLGACLARIRRDPRHERFELRAREAVFCRLFRGQAMALRSRACIAQGLLDAFAYRPGFPVERFPSDVLVEFLVGACRGRASGIEAGAARLDSGSALF